MDSCEDEEQANTSLDYCFLTQRCGSGLGEAEGEEAVVDVSDKTKARPLMVMKDEGILEIVCMVIRVRQ